jgi:hypothetical protein
MLLQDHRMHGFAQIDGREPVTKIISGDADNCVFEQDAAPEPDIPGKREVQRYEITATLRSSSSERITMLCRAGPMWSMLVGSECGRKRRIMNDPRQVLRNSIRQLVMAVLLISAFTLALPASAADNKACKLLTVAELEPVAGGKPSAFTSTLATPDAQICTATAPNGTVMLRWATKKPHATDYAAKGIEMAKKMGVIVEVKTFGPITCSTFIPPKGKEAAGFNTTCSVDQGGVVAAVEITAKNQKDMVSIDKLRPLAEKIATRM